MKENEKIQKLFNELHNGEPWLDVTLTGMLKGINASRASAKPLENIHSIWEIIVHITFWRINLSRKLTGEKTVREDEPKDWDPIKDTSESAWRQTLECFDESIKLLSEILANIPPEKFDDIYTPNNTTYWELLYGTLEHDAYHLGQIVLLRKLV